MELVQQENYLAALEEFEKSYALFPEPRILYNIAMCQKALFRYVDARASFKRFLAEAGKEIPDELRGDAQSALEELGKLVGGLVVTGAPEGAEVVIDSDLAGRTPLEPLTLDPGRHAVLVTKEGYRPFRGGVTIESGKQAAIVAELEVRPARIVVKCEGGGAVVFIDNEEVGGCPYEGELPPGPHEIEVSSPQKRRVVQTVELQAGGLAVLSMNPKPKAPVAQKTGDNGIGAKKQRMRWNRPLLIGGIATAVLGAGAGAVGGYFTYRGFRHQDQGESAAKKAEFTSDFGDYEDLEEEHRHINDKELPRDRIGTVVGYAAGGVLLTAAVVMILKSRGEEEEPRVSLSPAGVAVRF